MTAAVRFADADRGRDVTYSILLRNIADSDRLFSMLPAGSAMQMPDLIEGVPYKDSGYRGVTVYARDKDAFLARLRDAGITDTVYLVEPRALRPVQGFDAPSSPRVA